eukprot:255249-Prorocentrum_minimum.AAC.1
MDLSDARRAGIFSQWTNLTQDTRVYSHQQRCREGEGGQMQHRAGGGYNLTMDLSDAGHAGIFSRWTNLTQDTRVYSHQQRRREGEGGQMQHRGGGVGVGEV